MMLMLMKEKYFFGNKTVSKPVTIGDAALDVIERAATSDGALERVKDRTIAASEMLARLIETLADRDLLTADEVTNIVGYPYEVIDET